ncbi:hypothetical protein DICPUDRAFT_28052 [Dictyostelium purpureum]|uniref:Expansin-like EG45 domain-containing protein n=1 Tax=Dictyostelium purpureum TaxID=5786 RepID=F0ZB83_DICPU|nr:uncharacterized protein DICPUDRAFT_28052 [Dictyostelium purpureum]EGC38776.1 hypothetical protein DICPUDRAFT_28052 [Dictyostelium purpureum]|eukprot:XP_003284670.1 hypothetical protein DICPUDRAFT_28052 [Dictyostelium purpureum]
MRLNILILLLIISSFNSIILAAYIKMGECGQARAAPSEKPPEKGGMCQLPPPTRMGTASLSIDAFGNGARCGACYQLTGPIGKTVVMVTDSCNDGDACVQQDLFNFIISNKDFDKIGNSSSYSNIYSLGYQEVSCDFAGNIKAVYGGGLSKGLLDYSYYLTIAFHNFNTAIKQVRIKGSGMANYSNLRRTLGKFTWNQESGGVKFDFPATVLITSTSGQILQYTIPKKPPANIPQDTKLQFMPKPTPELENSICDMGLIPEYIYTDYLTFGWVGYNSWRYNNFNLSSQETDDNTVLGTSVVKIELNGQGGLQFTREGGFKTKYLDTLSFDIKVSPPTSSLQVYFGRVGTFTIDETLSEDWSNVELSVKRDLQPDEVEYSLSFYNNQAQTITLWIDNIKWGFSADAPKRPPTDVDTSTTKNSSPNGGSGVGSTITANIFSSIGITSNKNGVLTGIADGGSGENESDDDNPHRVRKNHGDINNDGIDDYYQEGGLGYPDNAVSSIHTSLNSILILLIAIVNINIILLF